MTSPDQAWVVWRQAMTRFEAIEALHNELLTIKEYAHATRRHPERIRQLCREGKLEGAVRIGGRWMVRFVARTSYER